MSLNYLEWAFRDCGLVELVHQASPQRFARGLYDDIDQLRRDARPRLGTGNLFISLNKPRETEPYAIRFGRGLGNADMCRVVRLLFDFDPVRPTGLASTEAELRLAVERAYTLENYLSAFHWPLPARALSGNGVHRLYRVALPVCDDTKDMLRMIYHGFADFLSDDLVTFDASVSNPGRICTLYGSTGPASAERPHRQSQVQIPSHWEQVKPAHIRAVAEHFRPQLPAPVTKARTTRNPYNGKGPDYRSLDIVGMFQAHGLYFRPDPQQAGKHFVRCPWESEHSSTAGKYSKSTVIFETVEHQWPNFYCAHDHCSGRGIREVINIMDVAPYCSRQLEGRRDA